jgi:GTP cyclohydrolase I
MTVQDVIQWIDSFAPFATQEEYDNSGLLLGEAEQPVSKVLFALDATPGAAAEAVRIGADLIVTHHPLMFLPVRQLHYRSGEGPIIRTLMQSGVAMIAAHTNLDQCPGGVAESLAEALALQSPVPCKDTPYLRTGTLPVPRTAGELLREIAARLSACTRLYGDPKAVIRTVTVTPGAGSRDHAYVTADAFVTGEVAHHELLALAARGITVFDAGHYPTEFPGIAALYRRFLADASKPHSVEAVLYAQPPYPCTAHGSSAPGEQS